jgi:serine/threonine-protein phosphatase 2A regulatory subunit B'
VQDPKTIKKERQKVEEKWKLLTKQAALKNANFKEPLGKEKEIL